jgi:hypothetical protein
MFFFLNVTWILQQVCKIQKNFGLYFKNIDIIFGKKIYYSFII